MTVAALNVSSGPYTGTGATTVFPFTFSASSAAEVQVLVNSVVVTVGFTISLSADQSTTPGGSVTFAVAPVNGAIILITSNPSFQQLISFKDSGPFLQSTLDIALDRIARLILYLKDKLSRAVVFPLGETVSALPAKASRLNKYLGFDASGDFAVLSGTTGDTALRDQLAASTGYSLVGGIPHVVTPQQYGAVANGVTDDSAAFVAAIAGLKALALNPDPGSPATYSGSPKLFIPAGHYYLGTTALDITHTLVIEGEGSGQFGPSARGCSRLRWADGTSGLRPQAYTTSGDTGVVAPHTASGGAVVSNLCLEGGYAGTESDHHGLVIRNAIKAENLYIINWPGEGVKAWAGNVIGNGNVAGNVSTTRLIGVKTEGCRGGFDFRGSDANICTTINCEAYQNRQWGIRDESGGNTHQGCHAASNGLAIDGHAATQCTYSGNHYAVIFGQESGASVNAPSGTATDNTYWYYIEAGTVTTEQPTWVSGMTWRTGGDYLTLYSAATLLLNCYSEGGGFSQLTGGTILAHGTILRQYLRGGWFWSPASDGLTLKMGSAGNFFLETALGQIEVGLYARDSASTVFGYIDFLKTGGCSINGNDGVHLRAAGVTYANVTPAGLDATAVSSTGPISYTTGAGGAITQATSRTTGVTLNKICGAITLFSAAGTATWQTFTVTNSTVAATDSVRVVQKSGTDKNMIHVTAVGAGSFDVTFATTGGTTTEQPVFNFAVIKAVSA